MAKSRCLCAGNMVAFNSPEDLHDYLEGLQTGYGARYALMLWDQEVRYSEEIQNASEATLQGLGVLAAHSGKSSPRPQHSQQVHRPHIFVQGSLCICSTISIDMPAPSG